MLDPYTFYVSCHGYSIQTMIFLAEYIYIFNVCFGECFVLGGSFVKGGQKSQIFLLRVKIIKFLAINFCYMVPYAQ